MSLTDTAPTPAIAQRVRQWFPNAMLSSHAYRGQETLIVKRDAFLDVARFLKTDSTTQFDFLMDLTAVDYKRFGKTQSSAPTLRTPSPLPYYMSPAVTAETWDRGLSQDDYRFELVCHFVSTVKGHRLRVKVPIPASDPVVPSVTSLWLGANWFEREAWDMFGITFTGHPNLRRILMYEGFEGHPLRKDYPINKRQPIIGPNV